MADVLAAGIFIPTKCQSDVILVVGDASVSRVDSDLGSTRTGKVVTDNTMAVTMTETVDQSCSSGS